MFNRQVPEFTEVELNFKPVQTINIPPVLAWPIMAGLCTYKDIYELSLEDFYNMNEILQVKHENEYRSHQAIEKETKKR